jgi:hypothetical protein
MGERERKKESKEKRKGYTSYFLKERERERKKRRKIEAFYMCQSQ